jgi:hypothetical protein
MISPIISTEDVESKPQGELTGKWVREVGGSESHFVMRWIGF